MRRAGMSRKDDPRQKALQDLQEYQVLMLNGHFDFGNGYHGRVYLNPHQLFRYPSTIWRFAQDLLDVLPASDASTAPTSSPVRSPAARCWRTRWLDCSTAVATSPARRRCSHRSRPTRNCGHSSEPLLSAAGDGPARAARGRRAEHRADAGALRRAGEGGRRNGDRDGGDLRPHGGGGRPGCPELRPRRIQGAGELPAAECPLCKSGHPISTF